MYELSKSHNEGVENAGSEKSIFVASVKELTGLNLWYLDDVYLRSMRKYLVVEFM